jgi:hypothetical protein
MAKTYELANESKAAYGYTHMVTLDKADLASQTTANTVQTVTILSLEAGDVIDHVAVKLATPFKDASDSAFNTTTLSLGVGGNTTRLLTATELNENGTEITYAVGTGATPLTFTASNSVTATFGSMTAKALSDIDTGEARVYLRLNKLSKL